ncbi:diguanylate cyclase [Kineococcus rubinsiae]|uniref:diguanylate cyclase n=1 Tax=Kineococcus rubinsiae TaxID=2609562 RepID=UPI001431452E|nr:diguanylate cyclase [Kineococcus rubinsiae]NIZ92416.1 diguanylate cyclase [Kineococcus rubinsiae]
MPGLAVLVAVASAVTAVTAVLCWRRRTGAPAAGPLVAGLASVTLWGASVAVAHAGVPLRVQALLVLPQFAGVAATVVAIRRFADVVTRGGVPRWRRLLLVEPALLMVVLALDPWLHVFHATVSATGDPPTRTTTAGWAFWVHSAYSYLVIASGGLALVRARRRATGQARRQLTTMLVALGAPVACNVAVNALPPVWFPVDLTPVSFAVTGLLFSWAVLRQDLLRLLPVARSLVVDTIEDAVLVIDRTDRLVDLNPAAAALLPLLAGLPAADAVGRDLVDFGGPVLAAAVGDPAGAAVVEVAAGVSLDVRTRPIHDRRGQRLGRLVVARDVSAQLAQQRALERANDQLHAHVATIDRLRADLAEEATRDPLTGLRNRRRFSEDLSGALERARPEGRPTAVVLLDVDHFKRINDTHGHAVGDRVLIAVAEALRRTARYDDVVRYGGEEFVVVLPDHDATAAAARAEQLRAACAELQLVAAGVRLRVTLSAGVAASPEHGSTPDDLLLTADRALYAAKEAGRDRVGRPG